MHYFQQIIFILVVAAAIYFFSKNVRRIKRNIHLGRDEEIKDQPKRRWRNVFLLALGQKKMFKRPTPAILHFFVYAGFIIINIEILEIILDGLLGMHRLFVPLLGGLYNVLIGCFEILAVTVLASCAVFLIRRNILKVKRLSTGELSGGWPKTDANAILITEIVLMSLFLMMNMADYNLQILGDPHFVSTGPFWVSGFLAPLFSGFKESTLLGIERTCWWMHIVGILAFLNYLPYSKHFHIILAFPNAYYARLNPQGEMKNMQNIQKEVLYMMEPDKMPTEQQPTEEHKRFGAKDIMDLSWKNLMDAYSCTECGRCTAACPASITGKLLSPRKIMMDTRDRMEEVGRNIDKNGSFVEDGKSLLHDYITAEELRACTSCNACVEACPVSIEPLSIINELRRYLVMEESNAPQEWNAMFNNIETSMSPWKFSPDDRDMWMQDMNASSNT